MPALHRAGFAVGAARGLPDCKITSQQVRQEEQPWLLPLQGGGFGAFLYLTQPENPPRSCSVLLHQPRGRLQQAPGLPLLAAAWGSHSSDAELQQGCDLLQWPLGFVGTAAGHGPLNQFHRISSTREMLMCAQTCPTAGRAQLEQTLQDAAPASSPNLHTDLLLPHKVSVAIIQHQPW